MLVSPILVPSWGTSKGNDWKVAGNDEREQGSSVHHFEFPLEYS